jgi:hypothetical protein
LIAAVCLPPLPAPPPPARRRSSGARAVRGCVDAPLRDHVTLPDGRGLVHLTQGRALRLIDCMIVNAGGNGVKLDA